MKGETSEVLRDKTYKGLITFSTESGYIDIRWTFSCERGSPPSVVFTDGSGEVALFSHLDEKRSALLYMIDICMANRKSGRETPYEVICRGTGDGVAEILRQYSLI
ncbi:MAG: hypothetical protein HYW27_00385 [Candidatus Aenigmarchaeota archaeon]|nr:hypothetical protein [Candidatus Aenigmarchaeota archaeon]